MESHTSKDLYFEGLAGDAELVYKLVSVTLSDLVREVVGFDTPILPIPFLLGDVYPNWINMVTLVGDPIDEDNEGIMRGVT